MDIVSHEERVDRQTRAQKRWVGAVDALPDGAFVTIDDRPHLVLGDAVLPWSWSGYGPRAKRPHGEQVEVLTPPGAVAVLREGFQPIFHPSAIGSV